jgi:predicted LPLAT superfamily acyltransferase
MKKNSNHWSEQREAARGFFLKITFWLFKILPGEILRIVAAIVALFYWAFSSKTRRESRKFLLRAGVKKPNVFKHIFSFSIALVEKMEVWGGKVRRDKLSARGDTADLVDRLRRGEGAILICSHLGNIELLRSFAHSGQTALGREVSLISIVDFDQTARFNRMIKEVNPSSMTRLISSNAITPATIVELQEQITSGGLAVIAGDRTSANSPDRAVCTPFLGKNARFPYGVFLLCALLEAPIYFIFALREKDICFRPSYFMIAHSHIVKSALTRKERQKQIEKMASGYAALLEIYAKNKPYQWYNFYDFWEEND